MRDASHEKSLWSGAQALPERKSTRMFNEIYGAIQQGQVLQQRLLGEAGQARRRWFASRMRRTLASK